MTRAGYPVEGLTNARFYGIHVDGQPSGAENRYGAEYRPVFYIKASEKYAEVAKFLGLNGNTNEELIDALINAINEQK